MSTRVRYGIAGTGMMGLEHIANIGLLAGAEVAAIYEPDEGQCALAMDRAPHARRHDTFETLAGDNDIDCLLIVSPNHLHVDQLETALAKRSLPVLVEKPLFTAPTDAARVEAIAARNPLVWVAMEYRYMPPIATFLDKVEDATGGIAMLTIREHRFPFLPKVGNWNRFNRYTGGTLVEKCCHFFDLMRLALRSEPVRVMASAGQAFNHREERYDGAVPDIWDHGYAIVDFASGARAMLELCMFAEGARYQEEVSAIGKAGKIEAFVPGPTRFWPDDLGPAPVAKVITSPRDPKGPREEAIPVDPALLEAGDHNGSTFYQHERFARIVRTGGMPEVSLTDGAQAVRMGLAAQRSAQTGRVVHMDEI